MTREEKIEKLLNFYVWEGEIWGSYKDFNRFVSDLLEHGFKGYEHMTDEELDSELEYLEPVD